MFGVIGYALVVVLFYFGLFLENTRLRQLLLRRTTMHRPARILQKAVLIVTGLSSDWNLLPIPALTTPEGVMIASSSSAACVSCVPVIQPTSSHSSLIPTHTGHYYPTDNDELTTTTGNLAACISTNLTSFNVTVPPSAVPNGAPYSLDYKLFDFHPNGTAREFSPIWSGFEGSRFSIAGSNKTDPPWTRYDHRYEPDNFFRPWYGNVSCEALACAMACANDLAAPSVPFVKTDFPELDACVEACPGYGWDPRVCVTENAVVAAADEGGDEGGEEDESEGGGPSGSSTVTAPLRPTEDGAAASETASSTSPSSGSKTVFVAQWGSWMVVLMSMIMIKYM